MSLNPRITKDGNGILWLEWDPDATAEGYYLYRDGAQVSRTFDPARRKAKLGVDPGVEVSAGVAVADVSVRPVETTRYPDTQPPPPSGMGAKLRAAFPPLPAPAKTVENRVLGNTSENGSDVLYRNNEHSVSNSGHGMLVHGGAKRVVIERARIHDASGQSNTEGHDGSRQGIATYAADGTPEDLRVISGEVFEIGGQRFSHGLYFAAVKRGLVQAHLAHDIGDFVYQWYPGLSGVTSKATAVNCTFGWARDSDKVALVVWAEQGTWEAEVYNSIIWGDVMLRGNSSLKLRNCVVPPQFSIDDGVDIDASVLRIDPKFTGHFIPTDSRVLTGADPGWVPPFDYKGAPYTRATIGAVAA